MDWSIEAGDIINIVNGGTTYSIPIFQQSMAWRGGYVVSDLLSDGDNVRPVLDYDERTYYRLNSEMSKKVGDNEIISKINQTTEQITIQANKLSLLGYTTINDGFKINLDGTFEAKGATIDGTINVGKNNNSTGLIKIYDSTGTQTGQIDNKGVRVWEEVYGGLNTRTAALSSGILQIKFDDVTSSIIGIAGVDGGGYIGVNDGNDVARLSMSASDGVIPSIETYTSSGLTASTMTEKGFGTYYPTRIVHRAISLQNDQTHSYLYLNRPDGTTDIALDTDSGAGSFFNTKVAANAGLSVTGDLTVNGTIDVTPRRCYATLSSDGWYRVFTVTGQGRAALSWMADLCITRVYLNADNEVHSVKLMAVYDSFAFTGENSKTNMLGVDKIRYTRNGTTGHVDIHYSLSNANSVAVDFNIHVRQDTQANFTANSLESVAASPSGETVMTEYTFAANTNGPISIPTASVSGTTIDESYAYRCGNVVHYQLCLHSTSSSSTIAVSNGTVLATGFLPPQSVVRTLGHYWYQNVSPLRCLLNTNGELVVFWDDGDIPWQPIIFEITYFV